MWFERRYWNTSLTIKSSSKAIKTRCRMILVLSSDMYEQGTDPVVDWLAYYGAPFLRLSMGQLIYGKTGVVVDVDKESLLVNNVNIREEVNVVWFSRMLHKKTAADTFGICKPKSLQEDIGRASYRERGVQQGK